MANPLEVRNNAAARDFMRDLLNKLASYLSDLTLHPDYWKVMRVRHQFLRIMDDVTDLLYSFKEHNKVIEMLKAVTEILPNAAEVYYRYGNAMFKRNNLLAAVFNYFKAHMINPDLLSARESYESLLNMYIERWHFPMLNDKKRNEAFENAITKIVQEKKVKWAVDIGSGTGILSMMAVDAGATKVFALDASAAMKYISSKIIFEYGMEKNISVITKHSSQVSIPKDIPSKKKLHNSDIRQELQIELLLLRIERSQLRYFGHVMRMSESRLARIGLIISETIDAGVFGESILNSACHAHENLMNKSTVFLPKRVQVFGCLIQSKFLRKRQRLLNKNVGRLNWKNVCVISKKSKDPYTTERLEKIRGGYDRLSEPFPIADVDFNNYKQVKKFVNGVVIQTDVKCNSPGIVDALAMWFELYVDEDNVISSAPEANGCWEQAIFYAVHAQKAPQNLLKVEECDKVSIEMKCQDCFTLSSIKHKNERTKLENSPTKDSELEIVYLDSAIIEELNNSTFYDLLYNAQRYISWSNLNVIDIMKFPIGALCALILGANRVGVLSTENNETVLKIARINSIDVSKIRFHSSFTQNSLARDWHVLLTNPICSDGGLVNGILEDITHIRASCVVNNGLVIPAAIYLYSCLIESAELNKQSMIVNDDNTVGYEIAGCMNFFSCVTQLDLDLRTLKHNKLSVPQAMLKIDFHRPLPKYFFEISPYLNLKVQSELTVIKPGTANAMPYWFAIQLIAPRNQRFYTETGYIEAKHFRRAQDIHYNHFESTETIVSTLDMNSHWKQSAIMLADSFKVRAGQRWKCEAACETSCIGLKIVFR